MPTSAPLREALTRLLDALDPTWLAVDVACGGRVVACSASVAQLCGADPGLLVRQGLVEGEGALRAEGAERRVEMIVRWPGGASPPLTGVVHALAAGPEDAGLAVIVVDARAQGVEEPRGRHDAPVNAPALSRPGGPVAGTAAPLREFVATLAHDLVAPLRAVTMMTQWLVADLGDAIDPTVRETLSLLHGRVRAMDALVGGLRRLPLGEAPFDVAAAQTAWAGLVAEAAERGAEGAS